MLQFNNGIAFFSNISWYMGVHVSTVIYRKERNILEAAAAGASSSIKLVANIAANLIAFLAMLEFVNAVLSWFGSFVGYPEFSFQVKSHQSTPVKKIIYNLIFSAGCFIFIYLLSKFLQIV